MLPYFSPRNIKSKLQDCTIARTVFFWRHQITVDPALSKAYDVPNSVITNGSDRWCRHFIERRHSCPRSPYAENTKGGLCNVSPSGDRDGFVFPEFTCLIIVSVHVSFRNAQLLFKRLVSNPYLTPELRENQH